jgi:hypothetical protein
VIRSVTATTLADEGASEDHDRTAVTRESKQVKRVERAAPPSRALGPVRGGSTDFPVVATACGTNRSPALATDPSPGRSWRRSHRTPGRNTTSPHRLRFFWGHAPTRRRVHDVTTHHVAPRAPRPTVGRRTTAPDGAGSEMKGGFPAPRCGPSAAPRRPLTPTSRFFTTGVLPHPLGLHPSDLPGRRGARSGEQSAEGRRARPPGPGVVERGWGGWKTRFWPGASPRVARGRRDALSLAAGSSCLSCRLD